MKPQEYEQFVSEYYQSNGYKTEMTPYSNDYGIDVIAIKGDERIAIQAKMYGNSPRKINRATVMQLYGAMGYRKCAKAVIATDGSCLADAIEVANSLGIDILYLKPSINIDVKTEVLNKNINNASDTGSIMPFDDMWEQYIMPLSGKTISNGGLTNTILKVDWGGLQRMSSKGKVGKISIEDFKYAYNQLQLYRQVERTLINQHAKYCSSGIVLVLAQVPFIGVHNTPKKMLYIRQ